MSDGNSKLRTLVPVLPSTHLLKLLFLTRYVNCSLERSAVLLASPRGEVASRSDDGEGLWASQLNIALQQKIFPRIAWRVVYFMLNMKKRFADGNFVWN